MTLKKDLPKNTKAATGGAAGVVDSEQQANIRSRLRSSSTKVDGGAGDATLSELESQMSTITLNDPASALRSEATSTSSRAVDVGSGSTVAQEAPVEEDEVALIEFETKTGKKILLDTSVRALAPYGLKPFARFNSPQGDGTVVGIGEDGRLWTQLDRHQTQGQGISYYEPESVSAEAIAKLGIELLDDGDVQSSRVPLKEISYDDRKVYIVTQNENGPCPLFALANVLLLRDDIELSKAHRDAGATTITSLCRRIAAFIERSTGLTEVLLASNPNKVKDGGDNGGGDGDGDGDGGDDGGRQSATDGVETPRAVSVEALLRKLRAGLDVNFSFHSATDFDFTPEIGLFVMCEVRLVHGWLCDESERATFEALRGRMYNDVMEDLVAYAVQTHEDNEQRDEKAGAQVDGDDKKADRERLALVHAFHERTQFSQWTTAGALRLHSELADDDLCVLFQHNHFYTLLNRGGQLYTLLTDVGFCDTPNLIWEVRPVVDVGPDETTFFTANFEPFGGASREQLQIMRNSGGGVLLSPSSGAQPTATSSVDNESPMAIARALVGELLNACLSRNVDALLDCFDERCVCVERVADDRQRPSPLGSFDRVRWRRHYERAWDTECLMRCDYDVVHAEAFAAPHSSMSVVCCTVDVELEHENRLTRKAAPLRRQRHVLTLRRDGARWLIAHRSTRDIADTIGKRIGAFISDLI